MRATGKAGPVSFVVATVAAIIWFVTYVQAPAMGFFDTDDPAVSLQFLREHSKLYSVEAVALITLALSLAVGAFAAWDAMADRIGGIARRSITSLALLAAVSFFLFGVLRAAVGPLLYIDDLREEWGETSYLVVQLLGTHGFGQAALVALGLWIMTFGFVGWQTHALPRWLSMLAVVPAIRVIGSPLVWFDLAADGLWILAILAIPVMLVWPGLLGLAMLRDGRRARVSGAMAAASADA